MIRFIIVASIVVFFLILSIPLILRQKAAEKKDLQAAREKSLSIVQRVFRLVLFVAGVKVTVKGRERIPKDQAVLYIGNHRSYFDILIGYTQAPGLMGFVAKKEMEKIPLLSSWMKLVCCLFLDRNNAKEGLKTIIKGIEQIRNGISVWIFPEGTRNTNKDILELMPFKEGSLKMAQKTGCPVIPVAFTNVDAIFEQHLPLIRPQKVIVEFGEPIYLDQLSKEDKKFSGVYTRQVIIDMLKAEQELTAK